tara:strand:- start:547 stop:894 length:348 start_codon:yes stop_codon:yes gene_type:complete
MKKIIILLFLFPNLIFASFPIENSISDTISKDGRIYIKIASENIKNTDKETLKKEQNVNRQNNDIIKSTKRKRTSGLLGFFGGFFIIAAILVVILVILIFKLIFDSFASWGNSGI